MSDPRMVEELERLAAERVRALGLPGDVRALAAVEWDERTRRSTVRRLARGYAALEEARARLEVWLIDPSDSPAITSLRRRRDERRAELSAAQERLARSRELVERARALGLTDG